MYIYLYVRLYIILVCRKPVGVGTTRNALAQLYTVKSFATVVDRGWLENLLHTPKVLYLIPSNISLPVCELGISFHEISSMPYGAHNTFIYYRDCVKCNPLWIWHWFVYKGSSHGKICFKYKFFNRLFVVDWILNLTNCTLIININYGLMSDNF